MVPKLDIDKAFMAGVALTYTPNTDFVKVWNLLASGFVLDLGQTSTRALICPKGLSVSGGHFLLYEGYIQQFFLVHLYTPPYTTFKGKGKARYAKVKESHLVLMLPKGLSGSLSMNYRVLYKIKGQTRDTLQVQLLSNIIT
jgi:hypothetical protein